MKHFIILSVLLALTTISNAQGYTVIRNKEDIYTSTGPLLLSKHKKLPVLFISFNKTYNSVEKEVVYDADILFHSKYKRKANIGDTIRIELGNGLNIIAQNKSCDFGIYSRNIDRYSNVFHIALTGEQIKHIAESGILKVVVSKNVCFKIKVLKRFKKDVREVIDFRLDNINPKVFECMEDF